MALDSFTAKANTGAGTDQIAGRTTAGGFVGAAMLTDAAGVEIGAGNPLPVDVASLPLPSGAATETSLAAAAAELNLIEGYFKAEDAPAASGDKGILALAIRQLADTTSTDADGDYTLLKVDEEGRVKVATKPASFDLITGDITANAQSVFCDVRRASNVQAHMVAASLVGHNCTFEGSIDSTTGDNGNWFVVQAVRSNANTIETATGTLAATPAYGWKLPVNGIAFLRVRATAHTSGTATWKFQRGSYATEPIPAAQISGTQPVSGTVTANQGTLTTPTPSIVNSAATTNGTVVKGSAGTVYSVTASNINAAVRYLKLYNSTTVTVGTTTPAIVIPIPAGSAVTIPFGTTGMRFGTGICLGITTGAADNDTGAVAAGEIKVLTSYI